MIQILQTAELHKQLETSLLQLNEKEEQLRTTRETQEVREQAIVDRETKLREEIVNSLRSEICQHEMNYQQVWQFAVTERWQELKLVNAELEVYKQQLMSQHSELVTFENERVQFMKAQCDQKAAEVEQLERQLQEKSTTVNDMAAKLSEFEKLRNSLRVTQKEKDKLMQTIEDQQERIMQLYCEVENVKQEREQFEQELKWYYNNSTYPNMH